MQTDGHGDYHRIVREMEDLQTRIRLVENVQSPAQARGIQDLQALLIKVEDIDLNGSHSTRLILSNVERDLLRLEKSFNKEIELVSAFERETREKVEAWEEDKKRLRASFLVVLFAAAANIAVSVILWALLQKGA